MYRRPNQRRKLGFSRPLSKRSVRLIKWLIIAVIVVLAILQRTNSPEINSRVNRTDADWNRYHQKTFNVIKVVDGDTLDLDIPDGDKSFTRIRLWGVDTPETKHPKMDKPMYYGPQAEAFTRQMTLNRQVTVCLEPFENSRGKYGRLLAYIYLPNGEMLNELLLEQGFAYADTRFGHMLKKKFVNLEKQARRDQKGLWKDVRPDQWPQWYRRRHDPDYQKKSQ